MHSNQASPSPTRCKYLTGNNLIPSREGNCETFPQENYNREDTHHCNRHSSKSINGTRRDRFLASNLDFSISNSGFKKSSATSPY